MDTEDQQSRQLLRGGDDDGAVEDLAQLAEDVLRRDAHFAAARGALDQRLRGLFIEHARVDRAVVQLAERNERSERHAAVLTAERTGHQQREHERGDFVREGWIGLAAEGGDLGTLDGADETELRFDDAGLRGVAAEFDGDSFVKVDQILDGEVADAAVSR